MRSRLEGALGRVVRGSLFVLMGTLSGNLLGLASKPIITRVASPEVFGVYSLIAGILGLVNVLCTLGLTVGAARYVAYFKGKGDAGAVRAVAIRTSQISMASSLVAFVLLFLGSDLLGNTLYANIPGVVSLLRIGAIAIPFWAAMDVVIGIGRGHGDALPKVLFADLLRNGLFILFILLSLSTGVTARRILGALVLSYLLSGLLAWIHANRAYGLSLIARRVSPLPVREILFFSLPMMVLPMMWIVLSSMDTMILGHFRPAADVGFYNAAVTLSRILNPLLVSIVFIFLPVATTLYAGDSREEFARMYHVISKWVFILSFPLNALLLAFPQEILTLVFGPGYGGAAWPLRGLVLGYLSSILLSMNTSALTAAGCSRQQMSAAMITILADILLNALFVPMWGIGGAAAASAVSMTLYNLLISLMLYGKTRLLPFTTDYLRTILAASVAFLAMMGSRHLLHGVWFQMSISVVAYAAVFLLQILLLRCLSMTDMLLFDMVERKTGRSLSGIRALLGRAVIGEGREGTKGWRPEK